MNARSGCSSGRTRKGNQMGKKWVVTLGLILALGLLAGTATEAGAGQFGCNAGHACVWPSRFFSGTIGESLCTGGAHGLANFKESGVNECTGSNKAVWFRQNGTSIQCLNAGETSAGFTFPINELWVGAENSHC